MLKWLSRGISLLPWVDPRTWVSLSSGSQAGAPGDLDVSPSHTSRGGCRFHVSRFSWWFGSARISGICIPDSQAHPHSQIPWIAAQAPSLSGIPARILDPGPSDQPCGSPAHPLVQPDTRCHTFTHSSHKHSHTRLTALFIPLISLLYYFCFSVQPLLIILKGFLKLCWFLNIISCVQRSSFGSHCQTEIFSTICSLIQKHE